MSEESVGRESVYHDGYITCGECGESIISSQWEYSDIDLSIRCPLCGKTTILVSHDGFIGVEHGCIR